MSALEVDARGLRCPLPVIRLAEAARDAPAGTTITVLATDPAARHDIPAWCRLRDHDLLEVAEELVLPGTPEGQADPTETTQTKGTARAGQPAYLRFVVVVRAQPSKATGAGSDNARASRDT